MPRPARENRLRILLSGMVAGNPHQGGATWAALQYVEGLRSLGHQVVLVEPVDLAALDSAGAVAEYFASLPLLDGSAALLGKGSTETIGLTYTELTRFASEADLVINISGMLREERLLDPIPVRAFLDLDPGFNQVWEASGEGMGFDLHTHWVSVGQTIGRSDCPVPSCGREWIHTLPPVALEHWPSATGPPGVAYTTVGHWRSYGSLSYEGVEYGQRAHSMRELTELPAISDVRFRAALGIHPDEVSDLEALRAADWELLDPLTVAGTPAAYAKFIRGSRAELCVAKSGYVNGRTGWFSDRSACYLASGRPVVAQETGFSQFLPTGEGLLSFATAAEAADRIDTVEADLGRHGRAARELAEEHLDAQKVLSRLLDELAGGP